MANSKYQKHEGDIREWACHPPRGCKSLLLESCDCVIEGGYDRPSKCNNHGCHYDSNQSEQKAIFGKILPIIVRPY